MRWNIAQRFEKRWWKNYLDKKPPEEYLSWKHDYWASFIEELGIKLIDNQKILDAGCGPAGIFIHLKNQNVIAIDPLIDTYERELSHFGRAAYPDVDFRCDKLEDFEASEAFDGVFCLNVINHVEDLPKCLSNLIASLKPGGFFVLSIDSHNFNLPKWLFRLVPLDILHPHQFNLTEYLELVRRSGVKFENTVRLKSGFLFDYYAIVCKKY